MWLKPNNIASTSSRWLKPNGNNCLYHPCLLPSALADGNKGITLLRALAQPSKLSMWLSPNNISSSLIRWLKPNGNICLQQPCLLPSALADAKKAIHSPLGFSPTIQVKHVAKAQ